MNIIDNKKFAQIHCVTDPLGCVVSYQGRILRLISNGQESFVRTFLNSNCCKELMGKGLLIQTKIVTDVEVQDCDLVLEHEKIPLVTYPFEWTYSMLYDICNAMFELISICSKYGYKLKDGHLWNWTFLNNRPVFFDFSSIIMKDEKDTCYISGEFLERGYLPLKMWFNGDFYLAHRILSDDFWSRHANYNRLFSRKNSAIKKEFLYCRILRKFGSLFPFPRAIKIVERQIFNYFWYNAKRMEKPIRDGLWKKYYDSGINETRFSFMTEQINKMGVSSMIDLAGNAGEFSLYAHARTSMNRIVCMDYDDEALDRLYLKLKQHTDHAIIPVLGNVLFPIVNGELIRYQQRPVKCELAVAMALTHHLILVQGFSIDDVLTRIGEYATKYVIIEFMPWGLWGGGERPAVPDWYTVSWFRENFSRYFDLVLEQEIADNRIVFIGSHKAKHQ